MESEISIEIRKKLSSTLIALLSDEDMFKLIKLSGPLVFRENVYPPMKPNQPAKIAVLLSVGIGTPYVLPFPHIIEVFFYQERHYLGVVPKARIYNTKRSYS